MSKDDEPVKKKKCRQAWNERCYLRSHNEDWHAPTHQQGVKLRFGERSTTLLLHLQKVQHHLPPLGVVVGSPKDMLIKSALCSSVAMRARVQPVPGVRASVRGYESKVSIQ